MHEQHLILRLETWDLNLESWILKLDFCQIGLIFSLAFSLYLGIHPMYSSNKPNLPIQVKITIAI